MPIACWRSVACLRVATALVWPLCVPAHARAVHVEVGVGMTRFQDRGDGTWYQQPLPHTLVLRSASLMVGVSGPIGTRSGWHLDLFDLGHASSDSWDVMDSHYDPVLHACLGHCARLSHFIGHGSLWGMAAMLGTRLARDHLALEAGPWLFHQTWSVTIPNFYSSTGYPQAAGWAPWTSTGDAISHSASNWGIGACGGIALHWGVYRAWLLAFYNNHDFGLGTDPWPPIWRSEALLLVGRSF